MSDAVQRLGGVSANQNHQAEDAPTFQPGAALGRLMGSGPVGPATAGDRAFAQSLPYALLTQFAQGFWERLGGR